MAKNCPDCGAEVTYATRSVELQEATCSGCGHTVVLVAPSAAASETERAAAASAAPEAACWDCGGTLALTVRPNRVVEAVCEDCETVTRLSVAPPIGAPVERRPPRGGYDREEREPRPAARPCRQCGAQLEFQQLPDGTVEGSCPSCGNRFTMRPRDERRPGPGFGPRRGGFGGGGFRRPSYGGPRRRPYRDDRSGGDDEDRPRRRRRDDR